MNRSLPAGSGRAGRRWLAVGVAATLALTACGKGSDEGSAPKSITFWLSASAAQAQGYYDLAKEFKAKEGVSVEIVNVPNSGFKEKLRQAAQANALPDTASVPAIDPIWTNQLQDLSATANAAENKIKKDLLTTKDGKVLCIPSDVTAAGLFINKSLFDKAKVAVPADPANTWTWDEFIAAADKVRTATGAKYDLVYDRSPARIRAFIYTNGGKGFQFGSDGKFAADPTTVQTLGKFAALNNDVTIPKSVWTSGADPNALFKSGQVVAYLSGVWQVADFAESITNFKWASTPMPAQPVHATDINLGGKVVAFNNGNKAAAAKKFVDYIFQPANYTKIAQTNGYLPVETGLSLTYPFKQQAALDAFTLYVKEIELADPISSSGQQNQTKILLDGKTLDEDAVKNEMAKLINKQQDVDTTVKNILSGLNAGLS